jgi:hypothetical protein
VERVEIVAQVKREKPFAWWQYRLFPDRDQYWSSFIIMQTYYQYILDNNSYHNKDYWWNGPYLRAGFGALRVI